MFIVPCYFSAISHFCPSKAIQGSLRTRLCRLSSFSFTSLVSGLWSHASHRAFWVSSFEFRVQETWEIRPQDSQLHPAATARIRADASRVAWAQFERSPFDSLLSNCECWRWWKLAVSSWPRIEVDRNRKWQFRTFVDYLSCLAFRDTNNKQRRDKLPLMNSLSHLSSSSYPDGILATHFDSSNRIALEILRINYILKVF